MHGIVGSNPAGGMSVVSCQVEVSAKSWSLVQSSPTDCGESLCVNQEPQEWRGHSPRWATEPKYRHFKPRWREVSKICVSLTPENNNHKKKYYLSETRNALYKPYRLCGHTECLMLRNAVTVHNDAHEWRVKCRRNIRVRLVCVFLACFSCVQMSWWAWYLLDRTSLIQIIWTTD